MLSGSLNCVVCCFYPNSAVFQSDPICRHAFMIALLNPQFYHYGRQSLACTNVPSCSLLQVLEVQKANYSAAIVHNKPGEEALVQMAGGECECLDSQRSPFGDQHDPLCGFHVTNPPVCFCATVSESAPDACINWLALLSVKLLILALLVGKSAAYTLSLCQFSVLSS